MIPCYRCGAPILFDYGDDKSSLTIHHGEASLGWQYHGQRKYPPGSSVLKDWLDEIHRYEAMPRQQSRIHP